MQIFADRNYGLSLKIGFTRGAENWTNFNTYKLLTFEREKIKQWGSSCDTNAQATNFRRCNHLLSTTQNTSLV